MLNEILLARVKPSDKALYNIWARKISGGSTETTITGSLPLTFQAKGGALTDYTVYGTAEGTGVQTENVFNPNAQDPSNGFLEEYRLSGNTGNVTAYEGCNVSEYIPVSPETEYSCNYVRGYYSSDGIGFYDSSKTFLSGFAAGTAVAKRTFTTPADCAYIRVTYRKINIAQVIVTLSVDYPDEGFIPYGYEIPLTVTSGQNADTYPLYIGDTELGAEEYVDYGEQKVYKRTENDFPYAEAGVYGFSEGTATVTSDGAGRFVLQGKIPYGAESEKILLKSDYVVPLSVSSGGTYTFYIGNSKRDLVRVVFYDATGNEIIAYQGNTAWRKANNYTFTGTVHSVAFRNTQSSEQSITTTENVYSPMFSEIGDLGTYIPYLQPTDPPLPFPPITAYQGKNTLSSTETVGSVSLTGKIKEVTP